MTGHIWNRQGESFMLFQSATPAECLVTFRTGKWLFYCVDSFMMFKSPLSVKTGHIWNRQVESFMLFQSTTPAECLVTFWTGKWLLSCVDPFMIFKSPLSVNDWSHLEQANWVLHALWKCHYSWMLCHIYNRQMASLLCGSCHDCQINTIFKWLVTFWTG